MSKGVFVILGGNSAIGGATACMLAEHGWDIVLAGRSIEAMQNLANSIQHAWDRKVWVVPFDVADTASHRSFVATMMQIGDEPTRGVLLAAGVMNAGISPSDAAQMIQTNFTGAVSVLSLFADRFEEAREGTIVGVSSVAGDRGRQSNYVYGATKAALTAFLSGLRNRLHKHGVHVLTVKPGFVNTPMTAGMKLPQWLVVSPYFVGARIVAAIRAKRDVIYVPGIWRLIMFVIRRIPERVFKTLSL